MEETISQSTHEHSDQAAIDSLMNSCKAVREELSKVIVGQEDVVEQLLVVLLARGHALLEGVPGLAKTLLISTAWTACISGSAEFNSSGSHAK